MAELTIRDWMVIIGVLLITAVLLDAWRRVRSEKYSRVKLSLNESEGETRSGDEDLAWLKELPNGGARVVERGDLLRAAGELFEVVGNGAVAVEIGQTYPLEQTVQAHRDLEARLTTGSTLLLP